MAPIRVKASDLRLADVVELEPATAYRTATVKQIQDGAITFFRPYTATVNFSYTGGVICYIGIEEFTVPIRKNAEYLVIERKELK